MNNVKDMKEKLENVENTEETKQMNEDSEMEISIDDMEQMTGGAALKNMRPTALESRV